MNFLAHKFPQNLWAKEIIAILKSGVIKILPNTVFFDAPCGNAVMGHLISKALPDLEVRYLDNDIKIKESPYYKVHPSKEKFIIGDIFNYRLKGTDNVWLFINSLYCLPDKDILMSNHKNSFKYIIAVFPDIKSPNYRHFISKNPNFENPSIMTLSETVGFFQKYNYNILISKKLVKVNFHRYMNFFYKFRIPAFIHSYALTLLEYLKMSKEFNYELIVFEREK